MKYSTELTLDNTGGLSVSQQTICSTNPQITSIIDITIDMSVNVLLDKILTKTLPINR